MTSSPHRPRTIDASLPPPSLSHTERLHVQDLPQFQLPVPYEIIPPNVRSLTQCAHHQITTLQSTAFAGGSYSESTADALDDGFVLCDLSVIQRKLHSWRTLFPRIKPFFALKCNPDPMVAAVLGRGYPNECGYDCASVAEIRLALDSCSDGSGGGSNVDSARRCIYANPQRAERDLDEALDLGVECLVFDGEEELRKIHRAYQKRLQRAQSSKSGGGSYDVKPPPPPPPELVLRILVPDSTSSVPLGEKFGANPDSVAQLTEHAAELGLPVIGVSFHCGSGCHDPEAYGTALRLAKEAVDTINKVLVRVWGDNAAKCCLVDIGGGYPGMDGNGADVGRFCGVIDDDQLNVNSCGDRDDNQETAAKIAHVVTPLVDTLFPPDPSDAGGIQVIAEPGRYLVESAFALCMRIYSTRSENVATDNTEGREQDEDDNIVRHYYISQGVRGVFKDVLLCGETFDPIPLKLEQLITSGAEGEVKLVRSVIHGPSGEDFDIVCASCLLPDMSVGDWLVFDKMGAYTLSIAARSGSMPIQYVAGGHGV